VGESCVSEKAEIQVEGGCVFEIGKTQVGSDELMRGSDQLIKIDVEILLNIKVELVKSVVCDTGSQWNIISKELFEHLRSVDNKLLWRNCQKQILLADNSITTSEWKFPAKTALLLEIPAPCVLKRSWCASAPRCSYKSDRLVSGMELVSVGFGEDFLRFFLFLGLR